MEGASANRYKNNFTTYLKDRGEQHLITKFHKISNETVNHPYLSEMASLYSDWQGHASISTKRALVTTSLLAITQVFIFGLSHWHEHGFWGFKVPAEDLWRLKLVIILTILVSAILYLAALTRDKKARDFKAFQLRDLLDKVSDVYYKLEEQHNLFANEQEQPGTDLKIALAGSSSSTFAHQVQAVESTISDYEKFVKDNRKNQRILDVYDVIIIPLIGLTAVLVVASS